MSAWRILALSLFMGMLGSASAEIPKPADAPQPKSPEESRKCFRLPDGFRIDLIASEPLIRDPSCVAWDEQGRLFVTEIHGYNLEGHLDVTELNKSGKLDTAIRRVRVGPEMKAEARKGQHGSLKLLRDKNGDGRMDEAILWADDIPAAYGVVPALGGVIVTAEPHIFFFADTDGDDKPDVREEILTGFERGEMERSINNPVWGPDNWIYAGRGWGGATVTGPRLKGTVKLGRTDFRFKPDGSAIEPVSGDNHTFGMCFDDFGNRFLITTNQPVRYAAPLPYGYLARNPHVPSPDTTVGATPYRNTFPASEPHPWRRKRGADPRWVKFYGGGEAKPNGHFTSACGQQIYRAGLFPEKYHGNHFACDPQQSMVHRSIVERDGSGLRARRPEEQAESEFLTSTDGWFRPNNLRIGPDGALYIIDMYREIIEDYSAIPRYMQQQYGLLDGDDRGRIWRLAPKESAPLAIVVEKVRALASLSHPNAWWRETAQRLFVEQKETIEPSKLLDLSKRHKVPFQARIHALYAADGRGDLSSRDIIPVLADPHPAVRVHALRLAERWFDSHPACLVAALTTAETEKDPNVLLQLALSLGESQSPDAMRALARLAATRNDIRWMEPAVLSSIGRSAGAFLQALLTDFPKAPVGIIERATETAVRSEAKGAVADVMAALAAHPDEALRLRLLALTAKHGLERSPEIRAAADRALRSVPDAGQPDGKRLAALRLAPYGSPESIRTALSVVTNLAGDPGFQGRALREVLGVPNRDVAAIVVELIPKMTPQGVAIVTEGLLAHAVTARQLLEAKVLTSGSFSALQRHRLMNHEDAAVKKLAQQLFASADSSPRNPKHAAHFAALKEKADAKRGAELFATQCATCHTFGGKGFAVGPPLDGEVGRPGESLLADILNPAGNLTAGYATYLVKTKGGGSHAGVLSGESATSLTLTAAGGVKAQVLRSELASIEKLELSLMPVTFAEVLKPKDCADLIAYMKSRPAPESVVLFDDDPGFPALLRDGRGTARLDMRDAASGRACLTVEGFQRHSRQLPGWKFAICEKPKAGEFRYLRISMKTRKSMGMMLELAADRTFSPESRPVRGLLRGGELDRLEFESPRRKDSDRLADVLDRSLERQRRIQPHRDGLHRHERRGFLRSHRVVSGVAVEESRVPSLLWASVCRAAAPAAITPETGKRGARPTSSSDDAGRCMS